MNKILIVDDDFHLRDSLSDLLEDEGYRVASAGDGLEALEYLRSHPAPCLILLDWMMPRCDGAEFREVQRHDPTLSRIPVVLLTADVRVEERKEQIGAQDCLAKPVRLERLLDVVQRYCAGPAAPPHL